MNGEGSADNPGQRLQDRAEREAFVRAAYGGLFRWFCRLTGSRERAADLTQETFAAFWGSIERARENVSPRTWLYAIGRNLWRKQLRDRKPFESAPLNHVPENDRTPDRTAEDREFRVAAEKSIGDLPIDLREVFTLRFSHEFEYEEIATIQGITAGLARWRYFAARRRLHEALADWDPERERAGENQHGR